MAGNLWPAPYLDYTVCIIWLFAGGVLRQRGENLLEVINREKHAAQLLEQVAAETAQGNVVAAKGETLHGVSGAV